MIGIIFTGSIIFIISIIVSNMLIKQGQMIELAVRNMSESNRLNSENLTSEIVIYYCRQIST